MPIWLGRSPPIFVIQCAKVNAEALGEPAPDPLINRSAKQV
ncbi:hypothetical protein LMG22931_05673 [Paraburkholderia nemoris]|nr:hypothetical protein LMG22931_05673 [Paraburkholderia nemoris]